MIPFQDNLARASAYPERPLELLAPAGDPEAGYAALHYGADAVYVGLRQFSARAQAENFSPEELDELTAFAHSLCPSRRVFVTLNTVVQQDEVTSLIAALGLLDEIGVDAVIVQDLGAARLARRSFPALELHASTQMAVHNLEGARMLGDLGFRRVTLARELTLAEVKRITERCGIETEVFIHGALCYSYSGLCLFSSHLYGRSGNRGKCSYPCRDLYRLNAPSPGSPCSADNDEEMQMPFSMKDLALPEEIEDILSCGVSCLKIEGRMKSALYVACATNYYRRILDGHAGKDELKVLEEDLRTVFSRPWTKLYVRSPHVPGAVDPDFTGHRGALIGRVQQVFENRRGEKVLRFQTERSLEVHDGLQIEIPGRPKPYGFAVDSLVVYQKQDKKNRRAFTADAGSLVDVALPQDAPEIPIRARVFCSSSQAVKRTYDYDRPKPQLFRHRVELDVEVEISENSITAAACGLLPGGLPRKTAGRAEVAGDFPEAEQPGVVAKAVREAFSRLGDTSFTLGKLRLSNAKSRFVQFSVLNQLRRELCEAMEEALSIERERKIAGILEETEQEKLPASRQEHPQWSIKLDSLACLDELSAAELSEVSEVVLDFEQLSLDELLAGLQTMRSRLEERQIRFALPLIMRGWEEEKTAAVVSELLKKGCRRFEVGGLGGLRFLRDAAAHLKERGELDASLDWSVPVMNCAAALQSKDLGAAGCTLSPEDTFHNMQELLRRFGSWAQVILYQDTPLFVSETCARASLAGACPRLRSEAGACCDTCCENAALELSSKSGESFIALRRSSRTIVINGRPFCIGAHLNNIIAAGAKKLRADFLYRSYSPAEAAAIWRTLRRGEAPAGTHEGNFNREI